MQVVNLFGDEWDGRRDRPGWPWKQASVSERPGAELFGANLYEIESRGRGAFRTFGTIRFALDCASVPRTGLGVAVQPISSGTRVRGPRRQAARSPRRGRSG